MDRRRLLGLLALGSPAVRGFLGGHWPLLPRAEAPSRHGLASPQQSAVEAVVLGIAQDGGVPQLNCFTGYCARVRAGAPRPRVSCVGLVDGDRRWLIDATPDMGDQVGALLAPDGRAIDAVADRTVPLHEYLAGIFLTHAHVGHYLGLAQLGKEVAAPHLLPVYCTPAMAAYLRTNAPWEALVRDERIDLREITPGQRVELTERLSVEPFAVVHRPEYSDTVGYIAHGPASRLLFVPDADVWDGWPEPFEQLLDRVDTALLDGSFYSLEELGHRVQADVPHPPVSVTVERLRERAGRPPVWFIHLNHTNPLLDPESRLHGQLPAGFAVASEGQRFAL